MLWFKRVNWIALLGIVFMSLAFLAFFGTVIKKDKSENRYPYRFSLYYSHIDGIKEGTEVRILGVKKGFVSHIEGIPAKDVPDKRYLDPKQDRAIELTISMEEPFTFWDTYKVEFQTLTVFSNRVININLGKSDGSTTFFNPIVPKQDKEADFLPSARYFDDFFKGSSNLIEENREDIRKITSDLSSVSSKLDGNKGTIPKLIGSTEMYENLEETVTDAQIIGLEGRHYMESSRKLESTFPIPFLISTSFYGRTTLLGRRIGPQN